jgi:hypothetical protein
MTMGRLSAVILLLFASAMFSKASRDDDGMVRVGTWNVLLMDDEYHPSWGCPLQIALCSDNKQACTLERRRRVWDTIENNTLGMDVLCLQEADDAFFNVQSEFSNWTTVARSGECSVLLWDASGFRVSDVYDVALSGLSGCPSVPMVTLLRSNSSNGESEKAVAVGSLHLKSSLSNVENWYKMAAVAFRNASSQQKGLPHIVGGDYNHNLTSVLALPMGWQLAYGTDDDDVEPLLFGTTQKERNWMGNFDGFFMSTKVADQIDEGSETILLLPQNVKATVAGFMPKVVRNLPQNGEIQTTAQFDVVPNGGELLFSANSNAPFQPVPLSNPRTQVMSDHLLVTAAFVWTTNSTETASSSAPTTSLVPSGSPSRNPSERSLLPTSVIQNTTLEPSESLPAAVPTTGPSGNQIPSSAAPKQYSFALKVLLLPALVGCTV